MNASTALQQALRLRDQPELLTGLQRAPLPPEMTALIRTATGEGTAAAPERAAAAAFLQQVCLHAGADARRCLGLHADDDLMTARTHHRLLIRWLHPDRNPDHQFLAERVNSAWTALKHPSPVVRAASDAGMPMAVPVRSRFPVFLLLILAGAMLLLAASLLPDGPLYVEVAETPGAPVPAAMPPAPSPGIAPVTAARTDQAESKVPPVRARAAQPPAMRPEKKPPPPAPMPEKKPAAAAKAVVTAPLPPALPPAAIPVAAPAVEAVSAGEAEALLQQFRQHYGSGNLPAFMALFSPKAISLKGGREAIAADYSRLFTSTRQRRMALMDPHWQTLDESRRLRAGFDSELAYGGSAAPVHRRGRLEMLLVRENGQTRILELLITE